jgi:predicted permease
MQSLRSDLVLAVRQLVKTPGFTAAAVLTLALGIGATSAVFSLLDALFWRPLSGIAEPERAVVAFGREGDARPGVAAYRDLRDFRAFDRAGDPAFSALAAFKSVPVALGAGGTDRPGRAMLVTDELFRALGTRPALGRLDLPEDDAAEWAVLSHDLWTTAFHASPAALGETVLVRGIPLTVVGVAPAGFRIAPLESVGDVFVPMALQPRLMGEDLLEVRGWSGVFFVGRLAPGVSVPAAQAAVDAFSARLAAAYPSTNGERSYVLEALDRSRLSPEARGDAAGVAAVLAAAALAVLLIACANVAGLFTVRAARRSAEVAIRSALGAPRAALVRQLLVESLLFAALGSVAALALASLLVAGASRLPFPFPLDPRIDPRVLLFTGAVAVACGLSFGLLPALRAARRDLAPLTQRIDRPATARLRGALVVAQVALSLGLLVVATLLLRTVVELREVPLGFDPGHLSAAYVGTGLDGGAAPYARMLEELGTAPGIERAGLSGLLPGDDGEDRLGMRPEGAGAETVSLMTVLVSEGYFETLGVPRIEGRELRASDDAAAPLVAVVNRSLAERYWPGRVAVGRRLELAGSDLSLTVVGVVEDTRVGALRNEVEPTVFASFRQAPTVPPSLSLVVRSGLSPAALASTLRSSAAGGGGWTAGLGALDERIRGGVAAERAITATLGGFGAAALALAAVGLYGLLAFLVGERKHEIGVRMALGADAGRVRRLVVGRGIALAGAGVAIGLVLGVSAAGAIEGFLYGVGRLDPASLGGASLLLLAVAFAASWLPAGRAASLDPITVLRKE